MSDVYEVYLIKATLIDDMLRHARMILERHRFELLESGIAARPLIIRASYFFRRCLRWAYATLSTWRRMRGLFRRR